MDADGQTGYVPQGKVKLSGAPSAAEIPEAIDASVALADPVPFRKDTHLELTGAIHADRKLDTVYLYLWNERTFEVEYCFTAALDKPTDTVSPSKLKERST